MRGVIERCGYRRWQSQAALTEERQPLLLSVMQSIDHCLDVSADRSEARWTITSHSNFLHYLIVELVACTCSINNM
jgi:hypothetical protein